jgi:hypothetical protein
MTINRNLVLPPSSEEALVIFVGYAMKMSQSAAVYVAVPEDGVTSNLVSLLTTLAAARVSFHTINVPPQVSEDQVLTDPAGLHLGAEP